MPEPIGEMLSGYTDPNGASPQEYAMSVLYRARVNPYDPPDTALAPWLTRFVAGMVDNNITGAITYEAPWAVADFFLTDDRVDPTFNPYEREASVLAEMPWLKDQFDSGEVLQIPNNQAFEFWLSKKRSDYEVAQLASQNGFFTNLFSVTPDILTLSAVTRAVPQINAALQAANQWRLGGPIAARAIKTGTILGVSNALQRAVIDAVHENPLNPWQTDIGQAALLGFVFGAGAETLATGAKAGAYYVFTGRKAAKFAQQVQKAAVGEYAQNLDEMVNRQVQDLNELTKITPDGPASLIVLRTKETIPLIEKLQKDWAYAGIDLYTGDFPGQKIYDELMNYRELNKQLSGYRRLLGDEIYQKSFANTAVGKYSRLLTKPLPAGAALDEPTAPIRKALSLFFDIPGVSEESTEKPLSTITPPNAEQLSEVRRARYNRTIHDINNTYQAMIAKSKGKTLIADFGDGNPIEISNAYSRKKFDQAVASYLHRQLAVETGVREAIGFTGPIEVREAADAILKNFYEPYANELVEVGLFDSVPNAKIAIARRWIRDAIARDRVDFEGRLKLSFFKRLNNIEIHERPLIPEVIQKMVDDEDITDDVLTELMAAQDAKKGQGQLFAPHLSQPTDLTAKLPEGLVPEKGISAKVAKLVRETSVKALPPRLAGIYQSKLNEFIDSLVRSTSDNLLDLDNIAGVEHALSGTNPLRAKKLILDEADFPEFIDTDLNSILSSYHHKMHGDISARLAIKSDINYWQDFVAKWTDEDLVKSAYDPNLVYKALQNARQTWLDAAGALDASGQTKGFQKMLSSRTARSLKVLRLKSALFRGRPLMAGMPEIESGWSTFGRIMQELSTSAYLGNSWATQLNDYAMVASLYGADSPIFPQITRSLVGMLPGLKLDRDELGMIGDALDSGLDRQQSLFDIGDVGLKPDLENSWLRKSLAKTEQATRYMAQKTIVWGGLQRHNDNLRFTTARMEIWHLWQGLKKMAKASEYMDAGLTESLALEKAGLTVADGAILNNLGFNRTNAGQLVKLIIQYGEDRQANPFSAMNLDEALAYRGLINPRFDKWYKSNPKLYETFSTAVVSRVRDIVVEPKIMSKPLSSAVWYGRWIHQFWNYGYAYGAQYAPLMSLQPKSRIAYGLLWAIAVGAISDAIHNELSGRRSLAQTLEAWSRPDALPGMLYAGINQSGMLAWLQRPTALLDRYTNYGPGDLVGNKLYSAHTMQSFDLAGSMGVPFDYLERLMTSGIRLANGDTSWKNIHDFRRTLPWNQLIELNAIYRATHAMGIQNPYGKGVGVDLFPIPSRPFYDQERPKRENIPSISE